jgi:hypothetical protein
MATGRQPALAEKSATSAAIRRNTPSGPSWVCGNAAFNDDLAAGARDCSRDLGSAEIHTRE